MFRSWVRIRNEFRYWPTPYPTKDATAEPSDTCQKVAFFDRTAKASRKVGVATPSTTPVRGGSLMVSLTRMASRRPGKPRSQKASRQPR